MSITHKIYGVDNLGDGTVRFDCPGASPGALIELRSYLDNRSARSKYGYPLAPAHPMLYVVSYDHNGVRYSQIHCDDTREFADVVGLGLGGDYSGPPPGEEVVMDATACRAYLLMSQSELRHDRACRELARAIRNLSEAE